MHTSLSIYQHVMGEAYERLSPPLRCFHSRHGQHTFEGSVQVDAPASRLAWLLALCLGAPRTASSGPIRFELAASNDSELWTRHFPGKSMRSRMSLRDGRIIEQMGPARLTFALAESGGALDMQLERMQFLGIPCPSWLMPAVVATETGEGGNLHFRVRASLPLIGVVASYGGQLQVGIAEK